MALIDILTSFVLGLLTPLTAVCVLPLYPGFLAYLANINGQNEKRSIALFGILVTFGVVISMLLIGLVFTTILQESLTKVIGILSPIAFLVLLIISLGLIFNFDYSKFLPKINTRISEKSPKWSAFVYGLFFGFIVIPCNPAFIAALFARSLLMTNFLANILNFLSFGIGMGFPLLVFSVASNKWSAHVIGFFTKHKRKINLIAGIIMLGISFYYLIFVFRLLG